VWTVVWQLPAASITPGSYRVVVSRIAHRGSGRGFHHRYTVTLFTPMS
jgi:hypothetical protein